MGEAGINGMAIDAIYGFVGPAGIPKPVVNRLHAEVVKAIAVASVKERFKEQDAELIGSSPDAFAKLLASEVQRWAQIIQSAGIRAD